MHQGTPKPLGSERQVGPSWHREVAWIVETRRHHDPRAGQPLGWIINMTVENAPQPGMGLCSVTGKYVPEDELVTIQGQRVCAEGKAILLDRLKAGEGMPGELEKPTVMRRFGGIFVDGLIIGVPTAIASAMAVRGKAQDEALVTLGVITMLSTTVYVVYFGALHASRGQSLGKMAAKTHVVNNADGGKISTGTAYVRALAYAGPSYLTAVAYFASNASLLSIVNVVVGVYGLANVLFALFDRNRQRALHDRIAGTRVVDKL